MKNKFNLNRKQLSIILCIIIIFVVTLSVAYAVLSTILTINGSAQVTASTWDFSLVQGLNHMGEEYRLTGSATTDLPTFSGTTMTYNASFTKPGDSVVYFFNIKNNGTLNGEINSIVNSTPTCTSSTGNIQDEYLVCSNLIYELNHFESTYINLVPISVGDVISIPSNNNAICLNGKDMGINGRTSQLKITLNPNLNTVPSSTVTISNLKTTIDIVQTEKICKSSGVEK